MCGIIGSYHFRSQRPVEIEKLVHQRDLMFHRGPDEGGVFVNGSVGLGIRRLSVIDLNTGSQPLFNEDKTIVAVTNGEIYNFVELRNELKARGHQFYTNSDCECIIHAYEEWSYGFLNRLNGMFGLALWDSRKRSLVLARDRLGKKPLYYRLTRDGIEFASELVGLIHQQPDFPKINIKSLLLYFLYKYIPAPSTIYEGYSKLCPGEMICIEQDTLKKWKYWRFPENRHGTFGGTFEEAVETLRDLIVKAVQKRLFSDVPMGILLSGGIDSASVLAATSKLRGGDVDAYTISFIEKDFDESGAAAYIANKFGVRHHVLTARPFKFDLLHKVVNNFGEPFADSSSVPTYMVSKLARENVTVVLSGDGGDEIWGGYTRYRNLSTTSIKKDTYYQKIFKLVSRVYPIALRGGNYIRDLSVPLLIRNMGCTPLYLLLEVLHPDLTESLKELYIKDIEETLAYGENDFERLNIHDAMRYLPEDVLTKVDRMSMANSLEVRCPLLDVDLVNFAASLPVSWMVNRGTLKVILRQGLTPWLGHEYLNLPKKGFTLPVDQWFRNELRDPCEGFLSPKKLDDMGIFNTKGVRRLWKEHLNGRRNYKGVLWSVLIFSMWHKIFMSGRN